ncbi:P-type conjugative transfer protein TrbL [Candidatus Jidaibacter acanthamoebae]|nr:P-type conjugative transfer protein TrbL [Candidatus Jidaibacter acanthamoeba]
MKRILSYAIFIIMLKSSDALASDILDSIAENYKQGSLEWYTSLFNVAQQLFTILATIEIAWTAIIWVLEKDEFRSLTAALIKKIMSIGFFYALLINADVWIPSIIDSFILAGALAGKQSITGFSPSQVLDTGLKTTYLMIKEMHISGITETITVGVTVMIASVIVIFAFAVIAAQLLIALIESYIVISGGVIFLGFGGSRWTTDFAQRYISYAFAIGVKLFVMYLLIGIGQAQVNQWPESLKPINVNTVLTVMGSSLVYMFLVWQIPSMAASILSGSPNITAGNAASTIASSGAMMIGGASAIGAMGSGSIKSMGGLASAANSAWETARFDNFSNSPFGGDKSSMSHGVKQFGSAFKHFASAGMEDSIAPVNNPSKTKGERMSSILNERTGKFKEDIAANTPFTPTRSVSENNNIPANLSSNTETSSLNQPNISNKVTTPINDMPNRANQSSSTVKDNIANLQPSAPKGLGSAIKNIAKSPIPHDSAPNTNISIKFNHTES